MVESIYAGPRAADSAVKTQAVLKKSEVRVGCDSAPPAQLKTPKTERHTDGTKSEDEEENRVRELGRERLRKPKSLNSRA